MSITNQNSADNPRFRPTRRSIAWWFRKAGSAGLLLLTGIVIIVLLGFAQRLGWIKSAGLQSGSEEASASDQIHTCPMHPQIRQPGIGRCPICGMALEPAVVGSGATDDFAVNIQPSQRRLANIQTAIATKQAIHSSVRTIGSIQIDESRQATIASYVDGRIERMFADYTGVVVDRNDHLAVIYSPELYAAQVEFLEAKATRDRLANSAIDSIRQTQQKLVLNSRRRLIELGMTEQQVVDLEKTQQAQSRVTIYAPIGGTVIDKLAEEGRYTTAGQPIYRVANLSTVWLMLELYPEDASQIRFGQQVQAKLRSLPGRTIQGRVAFIDPKVDQDNRTVGVRVELNNDRGELRPGDYAEATLTVPIGPQGEVYDAELANKWISPMHPQVIRNEPGLCPICGMNLVPTTRYGYSNDRVEQKQSLTIPRSALLTSGESSIVYVETEPGRFEIRSVTLGAIIRDKVVVLDGLKEGEKVATNGNFLIDSQMQLAGNPSLIDPSRAIEKQSIRNEPLQFENIQIELVKGEVGLRIEQLYQAYFRIQQTYATDSTPSETAVRSFIETTETLLRENRWTDETRDQLESIRDNAAHLHHLSLDESRQQFKPVSHAIVRLSTVVRGSQADQPLYHFFCPMVKQGAGDWLQDNDLLSNPYWGSQMLRCGELVRTISVPNILKTSGQGIDPEDAQEHQAGDDQ
ncbi:efflux RND transporter periplasmic adaptor subunit [Roseiconus lacunae]